MPDVQMTFTEHLGEFRTRLIRALVAVFLCAMVGYVFRNEILRVLVVPLAELHDQEPLQAIGLLEPFLAPLRLAVYTGIILAFPYVVYQVVMFCLPALLPRERRVILGAVLGGMVLLYVGLAFGGLLIVPIVVRFMSTFIDADLVRTTFSVQNYIDKLFQIVVAFGASFQLPMIMLALIRLGIVSAETLAKQRPYVIVGLVAFAAVITPPDVVSQLLLAGPLWILFEASLIVARLLPPPAAAEAED